MTAWHESARFDVFCDCDVYIEDGNYLYVENQPFNYCGDYICYPYHCGENLDGTPYYVYDDCSGAGNDYISTLVKAPWDVARNIIERHLAATQIHEEDLDKERDEDERIAPIIYDARHSLMEYATDGEKFTYC